MLDTKNPVCLDLLELLIYSSTLHADKYCSLFDKAYKHRFQNNSLRQLHLYYISQ